MRFLAEPNLTTYTEDRHHKYLKVYFGACCVGVLLMSIIDVDGVKINTPI